MTQLKHRPANLYGSFWEHGIQIAANHHPNQFGRARFAAEPGTGGRTVAKNRDAIRESPDFLKPMRYINDSGSRRPKPVDHPEKTGHLAVAQRRGGLVHDHDSRFRSN